METAEDEVGQVKVWPTPGEPAQVVAECHCNAGPEGVVLQYAC